MSARSVVLLIVLAAICAEFPLTSAFEWRKDPGTEITQTYPKQKTLVLRWEWRLSGGEVFSQARITRYKAKDKDNTDTYIGTLYSSGRLFTDNKYFNMSGQKGTDGGIDGYIEFTINDTNNQGYNGAPDSSKVDVMVSDYTYELDVTIETVQNPYIKITKLIVYVLPGTPVLQLHPNDPVFCKGDTINITCNGGTGNPTLTNLAFLQNDSSIGMLNVTTSGNYTKTVLSHALTQPGTLTFSCKASNAGGSSPTSNVSTITVKDPPVITSCTNKTIVENDNLVWTCDVNGSLPLTISWFKGNNNTVFQSGKSLKIPAVSRADSGMYRVTASNGGECPTASKTVYLDVQYKPRNVQVVPASVSPLDINGTFSLTCSASSSPDGSYTWSKNGVTLVGKTKRVLTKDNITPQDAGEYTCTVTNIVGNSTSNKVTINVNFLDLKVCNDTLGLPTNVNLSLKLVGNPVPTLYCSSNSVKQINASHFEILPTNKTVVSTCTVGNKVGRCNFTVKVYQQVEAYIQKYRFRCSSCKWNQKLGDNKTEEFTRHKKIWEDILTRIYRNNKYVTKITVIGFWRGSVNVNFALTLIANVSDPLSPLKEEVQRNNGSVDGFAIDSIQSGPYVPQTTTKKPIITTTSTPKPITTPTPFPVETIIGIAVGCALLLILVIILLVYCCYCKKRRDFKNEEHQLAEDGENAVPMTARGIYNRGSSPSPSTYAKHGPGANGNNNVGNGGTVYAQVDKSKKTKKPAGSNEGEVTYAVLDYGRGDNKSGDTQLAHMPSSGQVPEKHEMHYAAIKGSIRSSETPKENESADNSNKNGEKPENAEKESEAEEQAKDKNQDGSTSTSQTADWPSTKDRDHTTLTNVSM